MYHGALNKYKQKDIRNMLYLAFFLNIKVKFCLKMTSFSLINDLNHDKKKNLVREMYQKKKPQVVISLIHLYTIREGKRVLL